MNAEKLIAGSTRSIAALGHAIVEQPRAAPLTAVRTAVERGHFTPDEDDLLRAWFGQYLTTRAGLLETVADLRPLVDAAPTRTEETHLRLFALAYTAACLLVASARFLVDDVAKDRIVQRKLNEADAAHRIPRKQYTAVYRSLTRPANAWRLAEALRYADAHRARLAAVGREPALAPALNYLEPCEPALRIGARRYLAARLRYRWHAHRRRRASALQRTLFLLSEACGRVVADVGVPWHADRVTAAARQELADLLEPGDVLICRHDTALSNLFLPGYWPHAALHVGPPDVRATLPAAPPEHVTRHWVGSRRVLEARKDGVRFRALDDTLAVDAVLVLRPRLRVECIREAIARAIVHHGKLYNFDFDFFTTDRLVCTEVVYRGYEGIDGLTLPLRRRAGRLTLSAEDLVDLALEDRSFEAVAVFGTPTIGERVARGSEAVAALRAPRERRV